MKEKYGEEWEGIRGVQIPSEDLGKLNSEGSGSRSWGDPLHKLRCVDRTFGAGGRRAQRMVSSVIYTGFQTLCVSQVQSLGLTVRICEVGVLAM